MTTGVVLKRGLIATMSDGVELVADAWFPVEGGPFPVLLQRLPYGRAVASSPVVPSPAQLARLGYAVLVQDVRGRGDSGGTWAPFVREAEDGAATVEWAAHLPFSNGRVVMFGFSYQGLNQLAAAALRPRGLVGIAPLMCAPDACSMIRQSGVLMWEATSSWAAQLATSERDDVRRVADIAARPLATAIGTDPPDWYLDWVRRSPDDPYWAAFAPDLTAIEVPVFTVAGWSDTFAWGNARLIRELGAEAVLGPWSHMPWGTRIGSFTFDDASPDVALDAFLGFLSRVTDARAEIAAGSGTEIAAGSGAGASTHASAESNSALRAGVRYYAVGGGWRDAPSFPPPGTSWVLHGSSTRGANSRFGDGLLSPSAPAVLLADTFVSEPLVPFPGNGHPFPDVSSAEERRDVLCYTSAPFNDGLSIAGSPVAKVRAAAEGGPFDVVAALVVVSHGSATRIAHGIRRTGACDQAAPVQSASEESAPVEVTVEVTVELGPIAWDLNAGDALRLDISATCWPLYAVNPQSSRDVLDDARRGEHVVRVVDVSMVEVQIPVATSHSSAEPQNRSTAALS